MCKGTGGLLSYHEIMSIFYVNHLLLEHPADAN